MKQELRTRLATTDDLESILNIYNQGIEDRIATLEEDQKDKEYMKECLTIIMDDLQSW